MKEQSWHAVLIMVWRRILGEGLITAHTRDKKGPRSVHSSSPSPPPATGSVLFCSAQPWPPATTVCQTQGSVFHPPLTRSQQRGTLVTAHTPPHTFLLLSLGTRPSLGSLSVPLLLRLLLSLLILSLRLPCPLHLYSPLRWIDLVF